MSVKFQIFTTAHWFFALCIAGRKGLAYPHETEEGALLYGLSWQRRN